MFKLDLEKAEEPEIKLPTSNGSWKKQESSRKTIYFCFIDYPKAVDCVDHGKMWKILKELGIPEHLTCLLRNLHLGQEATATRRPSFTPWVGKILWRRKWQPTPVLLPGKSHGQRSVVGYSPWGCKELDTTERLHCLSFLYLFNLYAEYIMQNPRLDEAQAGIKIAGRNINNFRYADGTALMAESEEELKSPVMKVKEEVKKLA